MKACEYYLIINGRLLSGFISISNAKILNSFKKIYARRRKTVSKLYKELLKMQLKHWKRLQGLINLIRKESGRAVFSNEKQWDNIQKLKKERKRSMA